MHGLLEERYRSSSQTLRKASSHRRTICSTSAGWRTVATSHASRPLSWSRMRCGSSIDVSSSFTPCRRSTPTERPASLVMRDDGGGAVGDGRSHRRRRRRRRVHARGTPVRHCEGVFARKRRQGCARAHDGERDARDLRETRRSRPLRGRRRAVDRGESGDGGELRVLSSYSRTNSLGGHGRKRRFRVSFGRVGGVGGDRGGGDVRVLDAVRIGQVSSAGGTGGRTRRRRGATNRRRARFRRSLQRVHAHDGAGDSRGSGVLRVLRSVTDHFPSRETFGGCHARGV